MRIYYLLFFFIALVILILYILGGGIETWNVSSRDQEVSITNYYFCDKELDMTGLIQDGTTVIADKKSSDDIGICVEIVANMMSTVLIVWEDESIENKPALFVESASVNSGFYRFALDLNWYLDSGRYSFAVLHNRNEIFSAPFSVE